MDFINYLGIFILIWLLVGFLLGVKLMFVNASYKKFHSNMRNVRRTYVRDSLRERLFTMVSSRLGFLAYFTLMGFVGVVIYIFNRK